jgi:hypothetical protein
MKAGLIMPASASLKPASAYHCAGDGIHARNRLNGSARSTSASMGIIAAIMLASCLATGVIFLADCGVTHFFCSALPHFAWMAL